MSAIKDALGRVQQQRKETLPPKPSPRAGSRSQPVASSNSPARRPVYVWVFANVAVLAAVFATYYLFLREPPTRKQPSVISAPAPMRSPESRGVPALVAAPAPTIAPLHETRVIAAPEPAPASRAIIPLASDLPLLDAEYELSGMTAVGKNTLLSITRRSDRNSSWVPVGKTVGEVTAISYNPETNDAQIRVRGRLVTIRRR